jgi:hypothetical protein
MNTFVIGTAVLINTHRHHSYRSTLRPPARSQGVEVGRCCSAQCLRSLPVEITVNHRQLGGQRRRLAKNMSSVPDAPHMQASQQSTWHAHLQHIPILPDPPARMRCSRPKLCAPKRCVSQCEAGCGSAQLAAERAHRRHGPTIPGRPAGATAQQFLAALPQASPIPPFPFSSPTPLFPFSPLSSLSLSLLSPTFLSLLPPFTPLSSEYLSASPLSHMCVYYCRRSTMP